MLDESREEWTRSEPETIDRPTLTLMSCPLQLYTKHDLVRLVISKMGNRRIILAHQNLYGMALLQRSKTLKDFL